MRPLCFTLLLALGLTSSDALAADWIVSKNGGDFQTIGQAMAAASPNDRILVMPGAYPAFQFTVAVDVIGLGATPSAVTIDRVDYHVSIPVNDYDTLLSNVTVGSDDARDGIAISGNELPPGTFHIDGVIVDGAIFLASQDSGFYLLMTNSRVSNQPGEGFLDAAFYFGGSNCYLDIRNSTIAGSNGTSGHKAYSGLRLVAGTNGRLSNAVVLGGVGSAAFPEGATALIRGSSPGTVELRLDGGTKITGGGGFASGAGGHGVDVSGTIWAGQVQTAGGNGTPPGLAYADAQPTTLGVDLHLALSPVLENAAGRSFLIPGDAFSLDMATPGANTAIAVGFDLGVPSGGLFLPVSLPNALLVMGNSVQVEIPPLPAGAANGIEVYAQGLTNVSGGLQLSETASIRIDLNP
jgi:hypothetical protein